MIRGARARVGRASAATEPEQNHGYERWEETHSIEDRRQTDDGREKDDGKGDQLVYGEIVLDERVGSGPIRDRKPEIYGEILR